MPFLVGTLVLIISGHLYVGTVKNRFIEAPSCAVPVLRSDGVDACIELVENLTPRVIRPVDSNYDVKDPAPSPQPDTLLKSHA